MHKTYRLKIVENVPKVLQFCKLFREGKDRRPPSGIGSSTPYLALNGHSQNSLRVAVLSLRSKRSRTKRTKFGQHVLVLRIRDARKMGREQKGGRQGVGEGKEGFPLSPPPPPSFHLFAHAPFFAHPECEKLIRAAALPEFRSLRTRTLATQAKPYPPPFFLGWWVRLNLGYSQNTRRQSLNP